jgi:hypothetical protein
MPEFQLETSMTLSMSKASLPVCTRMLTKLGHILAKAEQFVDTQKIDPTALTTYRLAPDMLPFTRQVLIACDAVKNGLTRISGVKAPKMYFHITTAYAILRHNGVDVGKIDDLMGAKS